LSPTTIFNIDLSKLKILDNPKKISEWVKKLPPEKLSVIIDYISHIIKLFVKYHFLPLRCEFRENEGTIIDKPTGKILKMYEDNYRLFKKDQSLVTTLNLLNHIVLWLTNNTITNEPLTCLSVIAKNKK
jgi:hypothetical protein